MKKVSLMMLLAFLSMSCNQKKEESPINYKKEDLGKLEITDNIEIKAESVLTLKSKSLNNFNNKDFSDAADRFAHELLKSNYRKHKINIKDSSVLKHHQIFISNGLKSIIAYSNRTYPRKIDPNSYEHYTFYNATYESEKNALLNFEQIKSTSQIRLFENSSLSKDDSLKVRRLNIGAKPGGMIFQAGKNIFSLVESCRTPPMNTKWLDYENRFIASIFDNSTTIEILDADCGDSSYKIKFREF